MTRVGRRDTRQQLFPGQAYHRVMGAHWANRTRANHIGTIPQYFQTHTTVRRRWLAKTLTTVGDSSKTSVRVSRSGSCAAIERVHGSGRATESRVCPERALNSPRTSDNPEISPCFSYPGLPRDPYPLGYTPIGGWGNPASR